MIIFRISTNNKQFCNIPAALIQKLSVEKYQKPTNVEMSVNDYNTLIKTKTVNIIYCISNIFYKNISKIKTHLLIVINEKMIFVP